MDVLLANPRGFCAGVKRAILIVENALKIYKKTIYIKHELVHNQYVIKKLRKKGVIFVEKISDIPDNSIVVFSAHGVSKKTKEKAIKKKLIILNATCPLVTKVHKEVSKASEKNIETIFIGHKGHPEVIGTIGQYNKKNSSQIHLIESIEDINKLSIEKNNTKLNFFTQTTLSINYTQSIIKALKKKFPHISGPKKEDICYATTNRQNAVIKLSKITDMILVIGSKNSSNSNRLTEIGKETGVFTKQIESFLDIKEKWIKNIKHIGITAGASAPEFLVKQVIEYLQKIGAKKPKEILGPEEKIIFNIPRYLTLPLHLKNYE
ncbi:4-hydroxy-3-methylbut-2-enyl diphosphate reductase [Buchnera aphidicola (Aphis craccivora)]|uniref:4-hydroxy-3-methylbut-2-enyl diphosphate reductase n=1 Tax=Buchnera aphidicola (Aphis craccivora) TaxID=466616 RepID=A0A4D6XL80_9GAMM|nr:4-hydroxy-3-methylbut-2-enyl diphosphate reductase [Buchnera aphidicola]QCI16409.1 4-hydroxy-3-methylbut-2-enyl diphosphate reductase [Buchnera aphidicola (Aphis craccivora)]QLL40550.1 4-hydroxy-3-methylbut-2-enyl diphosphate reductase [Buchnera aphidicola (Aphis craccivore)]WAI17918.1 MAG: 4-hydroxy-3-methylbut-2-enyl diphosphate reductase [Buchnera aphidicola (Aphis craccivora)]